MILGVTLNNPAIVAVEIGVAVVVVRFVDELDEFVPLMVRLLVAVTAGEEIFVVIVVLIGSAIVGEVVVLLILANDVFPWRAVLFVVGVVDTGISVIADAFVFKFGEELFVANVVLEATGSAVVDEGATVEIFRFEIGSDVFDELRLLSNVGLVELRPVAGVLDSLADGLLDTVDVDNDRFVVTVVLAGFSVIDEVVLFRMVLAFAFTVVLNVPGIVEVEFDELNTLPLKLGDAVLDSFTVTFLVIVEVGNETFVGNVVLDVTGGPTVVFEAVIGVVRLTVMSEELVPFTTGNGSVEVLIRVELVSARETFLFVWVSAVVFEGGKGLGGVVLAIDELFDPNVLFLITVVLD